VPELRPTRPIYRLLVALLTDLENPPFRRQKQTTGFHAPTDKAPDIHPLRIIVAAAVDRSPAPGGRLFRNGYRS